MSMHKIRIGLTAVAATCPSAVLAQSTIAGPTAYAGGAPVSLTLPVTASVGGRCGFAIGGAPSGSFDAGQIDQSGWSNQFPFTLNCNGAARVAVTSANGGLRSATQPSDAGYAGIAPYQVKLNLVGAGGGSVTDQCEAATLAVTASAPCSFIGPATQSQGLRVAPSSQNLAGAYLQVSAPAYTGPAILVQGTYSDTLTVTVSAAL